MIRYIGSLLCYMRGHVWGRTRPAGDGYIKVCKRCGHTAPVKRRAPKTKSAG